MNGTIAAIDLGTMEYEAAFQLQEELAAARNGGTVGDLLLLVEHPPVITIGRGGGWEDLLVPTPRLQQEGVQILPTDRGGKGTYHGPGQLVAYPIFRVEKDSLYRFVWRLEEVVIRTLTSYGLAAGRDDLYPGVWLDGNKIAAVGLAVRDGITRHGLALNVAPHLGHFGLFVPCGIRDRGVTSMQQALGQDPDGEEVAERFVEAFGQVFERRVLRTQLPALANTANPGDGIVAQPQWLWRRISTQARTAVSDMEGLLGGLGLHTVCQEARCPNIAECFGQGTATFLILGGTCTRGCRFCAVNHGLPGPVDGGEPQRVAEAAAHLKLRHVVITSVSRDDLHDGGAGHFVATIHQVRRRLPGATVEVLIPDFRGSLAALQAVLDARPDVLNHNLETVPRLYRRVRPQARYGRSLNVLAWSKRYAPQVVTKSGLMLGLGERSAEVLDVLHDLRAIGCDLLTLGQYLQPTDQQLPICRYVPPEEFGWLKDKAEAMGFRGVASGPLVRSSHQADRLWAIASGAGD